MSARTAKSLFIHSSLKRYAGFYQQLLQGMGIGCPKESFSLLGNKIATIADHAYLLRKMEIVEEISKALNNFPLIQYQSIGQYYKALCVQRENRFDEAIKILERLSDKAPLKYRARAMLTLGAIHVSKGNLGESLAFRIEAARAAGQDLYTSTESQRAIAIIKSISGNHAGALQDLERLLPQARIVGSQYPSLYFDHLNSYAVELGETGRKDEARNISQIVLASPFAHAYPEWRETAQTLKETARSFVALDPARNNPSNVVHMPLVEHEKSERVRYNEPARVINIQRWKTKMSKDEKPPQELDTRQIINQIVLFYTNKNTTDEQRIKIWEAVKKIIYPPESDDSEGA